MGQYKKVLRATGHRSFPDWASKQCPTNDHPTSGVSWDDAVAYARWVGKRLPTEAEWEYAARGGLEGKRYPWGDDENLAREYANFHGRHFTSSGVATDTWRYCAPVGSLKPNGYGLYDIAGNAMEWCSDWYSEDYYGKSPLHNPQGPSSGRERISRGGPWNYDLIYLRVTTRYKSSPTSRGVSGGFRCVLDVP